MTFETKSIIKLLALKRLQKVMKPCSGALANSFGGLSSSFANQALRSG